MHTLSKPARGFSLIEVLVGMTIGLIGMVVMMQVFLVSDANKRTTSGTGDAQTNGTTAMFAVQRDLRQSGYGIISQSISGCNVTLRSGVTVNVIAPATINHASIPAGDSGSDTLLMVTGNSNGTPEGDAVILQPSTNVYSVTAPTTFAVADWIIAQRSTRASPCNLTAEQVTAVSSSPPNVSVTTGVTSMANGTLFNMGRAPRIVAYAVRDQNLTVCDFMVSNCADSTKVSDTTVWSPIAADILVMRAQYGRDTTASSMDGIVDAWDQITPGSAADISGLAVQCSIARVQAVRFAVVSRNGQFEKTAVTTAAPTWYGTSGAAIDVSKNSDGSANADWDHYRYRTFQAIVPLRNVVGLGPQAGC